MTIITGRRVQQWFFDMENQNDQLKVLVFADHQSIEDHLKIIIDNHLPVFLGIEVLQ